MGQKLRPFVDVLPAPQYKVLCQNKFNFLGSISLSDGSPVFVVDHAARFVEHFPAPLPGQIADVRVLHVEWREQRVESAQFEKLSAIERTGAAAAVETRVDLPNALIVAMPHPDAAVFPPALSQACFLPNFRGVGEKDLARY